VDRRRRQLRDKLLDQHEAPELAGEEVIHVATTQVVDAFAAYRGRSLKRILADVDHGGHVRRGLLSGPAPRLLVELEFEVVDADRTQSGASEVEDFLTLGWAFAGEQVHLVVAVEMILVGAVAELYALQQLLGDVGVAGGSHQRGKPIEA